VDPRLIRGNGCYIADLRIPGTLTAAFLRSPHAHARIIELDLEQARKLPGVIAVFGLEQGMPSLPLLFPHPTLVPVTQRPFDSVLHHVGEPVAMVIAESRYIAEDALDLIDVVYEPLTAVAHLASSVQCSSPFSTKGWGC
jgi:CO/xanthine dehydrogenase Mo-binding subunit